MSQDGDWRPGPSHGSHAATIRDVTSAWKVLVEAGVPDGAVRPSPGRLDGRRVGEAIRDLSRSLEAVEPRQVELLVAWLRGWRHHWPESFAASPGAEGESLIARLEARALDPDRYLELRRIAIENLSRVL
jgi:hypothetical protein